MNHHIDISPVGQTTYWILQNSLTGEYLSGQTESGQTTEGSDNWSIYLETTNESYWIAECNNLNIST